MKAPVIRGNKMSLYTDEPLIDMGTIGEKGTELYVGRGLPPEEIEDLSGSFNRLPPSAQAQVENLEIHSEPGKLRKVGDYEFTEGGHWSNRNKAIRVFYSQSPGARWPGFEQADYIVAHEAGHALFDKIVFQAYQEEYPHKEALKIEEKTRNERIDAINGVEAKYAPELESLWKEHLKKMDDRMACWGSADEMKKLRREDQAIERKMKKVQKQRDAEIEEAKAKYDPDKELEQLESERQPTYHKLSQFRHAIAEEGGITSYARAWTGDTNFDTENFAECMRYFYSGSETEEQRVARREMYPKTYAAFHELLEPEVLGHAVSLKHRPRERAAIVAEILSLKKRQMDVAETQRERNS
jgi:hypothetical protein